MIIIKAFFFALFIFSVSSQAESLSFNKVYEVIQSEEHEVYLVTDNGTWLIAEQQLIKIGENGLAQSQNLSDYQHLLPKNLPIEREYIQGMGIILLLFIFAGLYLYYQSSLNARRKAFYERIKVQQQVLGIAFLATGDEVLDCDLIESQVNRINKNANLNLTDGIYFQSEKFISSLHPEDSSTFIGHFESLLIGGGNNYEISYRVSDGDDGWLWIVERGCVIERDQEGKATRLVASMRDISALKHDQQQLERLATELEVRLKRAEAALAR